MRGRDHPEDEHPAVRKHHAQQAVQVRIVEQAGMGDTHRAGRRVRRRARRAARSVCDGSRAAAPTSPFKLAPCRGSHDGAHFRLHHRLQRSRQDRGGAEERDLGRRDRRRRLVLDRRHAGDRATLHTARAAGAVRGLRQVAQRRAREADWRLGVLARRRRALHRGRRRRDPLHRRAARCGRCIPCSPTQFLLWPMDPPFGLVSRLPAAAAVPPRQAALHRRTQCTKATSSTARWGR